MYVLITNTALPDERLIYQLSLNHKCTERIKIAITMNAVFDTVR